MPTTAEPGKPPSAARARTSGSLPRPSVCAPAIAVATSSARPQSIERGLFILVGLWIAILASSHIIAATPKDGGTMPFVFALIGAMLGATMFGVTGALIGLVAGPTLLMLF